jgi:hypothetical protein
MTHKRCTRCGELKDRDTDFPKKGFNRDGSQRYDSWCFTCRREYSTAYNKGRYVQVSRKRKGFPGSCESCKFLKPCQKIVNGRLTRDVVIDGVSTRIYLDPYCFIQSPLHEAFLKVYAGAMV